MSRFSSVVLATLAMSAPAAAADLIYKGPPPAPAPVAVSPWDFAVGGKLMSDYNFRGVSQTNRKPGVTAYGEIRYNINDAMQVYAGAQGWSVRFPTTYGLSDPSMELDLYAGVRPTFGALSFDFGVMQYVYPGETGVNTDFTEVYGKASYAINDMFSVGANLFYAPDLLNSGASGTYGSVTAKAALPYNFAVSGELGHYWIGTNTAGANLPDYTYWNAGVSYTYKIATLDLRYHDTTLKKGVGGSCSALTGATKWCGQAYIATLSFDITSKDLK